MYIRHDKIAFLAFFVIDCTKWLKRLIQIIKQYINIWHSCNDREGGNIIVFIIIVACLHLFAWSLSLLHLVAWHLESPFLEQAKRLLELERDIKYKLFASRWLILETLEIGTLLSGHFSLNTPLLHYLVRHVTSIQVSLTQKLLKSKVYMAQILYLAIFDTETGKPFQIWLL